MSSTNQIANLGLLLVGTINQMGGDYFNNRNNMKRPSVGREVMFLPITYALYKI